MVDNKQKTTTVKYLGPVKSNEDRDKYQRIFEKYRDAMMETPIEKYPKMGNFRLPFTDRCVIVADKGFFSSDNIRKLKKKHLSYIIPLRRNSSLRPEPDHFTNVFIYDGKPVKYWKRKDDVYIYEDPVLRSEEEQDYMIRIEENMRSRKQYDENQINFGKLYLLSDLTEDPEKIYRLYKQREYVEYAFNVYKNDLEADSSYLSDDHMISTYMFLNLLSLYLHFQILNMIDRK